MFCLLVVESIVSAGTLEAIPSAIIFGAIFALVTAYFIAVPALALVCVFRELYKRTGRVYLRTGGIAAGVAALPFTAVGSDPWFAVAIVLNGVAGGLAAGFLTRYLIEGRF